MGTLSFIEIGTDGEKAHRGRRLDVGDGPKLGRSDNGVSLGSWSCPSESAWARFENGDLHSRGKCMARKRLPGVSELWRVPRSARSRMKIAKSG